MFLYDKEKMGFYKRMVMAQGQACILLILTER